MNGDTGSSVLNVKIVLPDHILRLLWLQGVFVHRSSTKVSWNFALAVGSHNMPCRTA